jgi:hypothetical protein
VTAVDHVETAVVTPRTVTWPLGELAPGARGAREIALRALITTAGARTLVIRATISAASREFPPRSKN